MMRMKNRMRKPQVRLLTSQALPKKFKKKSELKPLRFTQVAHTKTGPILQEK